MELIFLESQCENLRPSNGMDQLFCLIYALMVVIAALLGGLILGYMMTWRALLNRRKWAWWVLTALLGLSALSVIVSLAGPAQADDPSSALSDLICLASFFALIFEPPRKWLSRQDERRRHRQGAQPS
jgi:MFS family permease